MDPKAPWTDGIDSIEIRIYSLVKYEGNVPPIVKALSMKLMVSMSPLACLSALFEPNALP